MTSAPAQRPRARARRGQGERLREEILEATERLLIQTGDQGAVSIRAIAEAAGVTPPSIYLHFADKDELLAAVCAVRFAELDRCMTEAAAAVDDPLEALRARGLAYVQFGLENPEHYRILFMTRPVAGAADNPVDLEHLPGLGAFGHLVEDVTRAMDAGALAAADPFLVATGLWTGVHGITSLLIARPDFPWPPIETLLAHIVDVSARGLAPS
ncbi:MAG TPA: TetR/AcrR family transcriptional regulator [Acidimicrobiales bacterium]|jgi:AcrR family transcriptional regulator|nr:TetR/AcrR family transcriptional regulator [Acidimicrobiales bacterium]